MVDSVNSERAFHEAFRRRLKEVRDELGWTQADMAEALGVPLENYKKYERRSKFPPHLFAQLARVTHRPIEFLLTGRGPNLRIVRNRTAN